MKLFTVDEANRLLPLVEPKLVEIQRLYARVDIMRDDSRAAAAASDLGGGMRGGTGYVSALYQIGKLTTELHEMGVELKDHTSGLVDFPSMRGDRVVLLCWRLGEGDEVKWWHEIDGGFAGRQPL
jgi:hypothetical protein